MNVFQSIVEFVREHQHSSSAEVLADAVISYCTGRKCVDLGQFTRLDGHNRKLFIEMLHYRCTTGWSMKEQNWAVNELQNIYKKRWKNQR